MGFLKLWQVGATPHRGARASHCRGLSRCGAQAPDAQAQQLWLTGPAAPRHVGSSQTRARTRVPLIGRQTLNHCATREARVYFLEQFLVNRKIDQKAQKASESTESIRKHLCLCVNISFQLLRVKKSFEF